MKFISAEQGEVCQGRGQEANNKKQPNKQITKTHNKKHNLVQPDREQSKFYGACLHELPLHSFTRGFSNISGEKSSGGEKEHKSEEKLDASNQDEITIQNIVQSSKN